MQTSYSYFFSLILKKTLNYTVNSFCCFQASEFHHSNAFNVFKCECKTELWLIKENPEWNEIDEQQLSWRQRLSALHPAVNIPFVFFIFIIFVILSLFGLLLLLLLLFGWTELRNEFYAVALIQNHYISGVKTYAG